MGLQPLTFSSDDLPVSLQEVKAHLRISGNDDDTTLVGFLSAAVEYVETETRQQLCPRDFLLTFDTFPRDRFIKLPKPPLVSVASVAYTDAAGNDQVLNPSQYAVDTTSRPGRIVMKPGLSWPHEDGSTNCVRITFTAGYPDGAPAILRQCILLLVGHFYENREGAIDRRIDTVPLGVCSILNQQMYPEPVG